MPEIWFMNPMSAVIYTVNKFANPVGPLWVKIIQSVAMHFAWYMYLLQQNLELDSGLRCFSVPFHKLVGLESRGFAFTTDETTQQ